MDDAATALDPVGGRKGAVSQPARLAESIRAWPDQDHLAAWLQEAGWEKVTYRNLSGGIVAVHRAHKPLTGAAADGGSSATDARTGPVAKLRRNLPRR